MSVEAVPILSGYAVRQCWPEHHTKRKDVYCQLIDLLIRRWVVQSITAEFAGLHGAVQLVSVQMGTDARKYNEHAERLQVRFWPCLAFSITCSKVSPKAKIGIGWLTRIPSTVLYQQPININRYCRFSPKVDGLMHRDPIDIRYLSAKFSSLEAFNGCMASDKGCFQVQNLLLNTDLNNVSLHLTEENI